MSKQKKVIYQVSNEILDKPSLYEDEASRKFNEKKAVGCISEYAGIEEKKLLFFLQNYGLKEILRNPDILGVTLEQKEKLLELKYLVEIGE